MLTGREKLAAMGWDIPTIPTCLLDESYDPHRSRIGKLAGDGFQRWSYACSVMALAAVLEFP